MRLGTEWLEASRGERYRSVPESKLRTRDDAVGFVNGNGLVTLFGCKGVGLPSLFDATYDTANFADTWWGWKNSLCATKDAFYGRLLQRKAFLSAWELFECFFALSGSSGEADECSYEYKQGRLGITARNIFDHLERHGPTATDELRRVVRMSDKHMKAPFERAMLDLQTRFFVAKVGNTDKHWGADIWDILGRWIPDKVEAALLVPEHSARQTIIDRYLATTGAFGRKELRAALGWAEADFEGAVSALKGAGRLVDDIELGEDLVPALGHADFMTHWRAT